MAVWAYKGVDARGKVVSGAKEADSPKTLRAQLRKDGIAVTDVQQAKAGKTAKAQTSGAGLNREVDLGSAFQRVKAADVATFVRQLGTLLKAGVPLAEALGALFEQLEHPKLQTIVGEVKTRVNEGLSLADSLAKYPDVFEEVTISMVRAGEQAGNLEVVLARLSQFMEKQLSMRSKVVSAMIYPVIMVVVGTAIMAVLMVAVIPEITQMFEDSDQPLPWNTVVLIWTSKFMSDYWWLWVPAIPLIAWAAYRWTKSPSGRPTWDRWRLKLPVAGPLSRHVAVARLSRTLATMLRSGVPLLRALEISRSVLGNIGLMKVIDVAREQIQQGESISNTLKKSGEFPGLMTHMVAVGERSGQLENMLENVAEAYEAEVDLKLGRLTAMLEPIMIVVMGGAVGFIVFSILMPIMEMNKLGTQ